MCSEKEAREFVTSLEDQQDPESSSKDKEWRDNPKGWRGGQKPTRKWTWSRTWIFESGNRKRQEEWGKGGLFNTLQYLCTHTQTSKTSALESPQSTLFIRFLFCSYITIATTAAATTRGTVDPCASQGWCGCSDGALVWVSGMFLGLRAVSRLLGVPRCPPWSSHCMDFSQKASPGSILGIVL